MKDGRTHLADQAEHAVDLEPGANRLQLICKGDSVVAVGRSSHANRTRQPFAFCNEVHSYATG
jgi:hypothetical protein